MLHVSTWADEGCLMGIRVRFGVLGRVVCMGTGTASRNHDRREASITPSFPAGA